MIWRLGIAIVLTGVACGAMWYGWENLTQLRRTWFWDLRYVVFAVGAFVVLSLAEFISGKLTGGGGH